MDLDTFFVAVERLKHPELIGKPIIISGGSDRSVVASCSYEARAFGVRSAMPYFKAKLLCPQAIVVRGDMDNYSYYSNMVTEIVESKAPTVEKASIDEHYIDVTGMDRYVKSSMQWAYELKSNIKKETGLTISFGLSANKTVSKIATGESKPDGERNIDNGIEKLFLAPLSTKKIPGIGAKTFTMLQNMGVYKIHTIQEMPIQLMHKAMGETGTSIWRKANGIDNTPVVPYSEQKSMSSSRTFEKDTTDIEWLKQRLIVMVEKLAFEMRMAGRVAGCVVLKLRYTDFNTYDFQRRIAYTASDHVLIKEILDLFRTNYNRRVLLRLIGIKFTHLVSGFTQINLFEDTQEMLNLYQSLDKIKKKYGSEAIIRAIGLE